jgi:ABC-type proline/glycine betaine transport system ATPase subunit
MIIYRNGRILQMGTPAEILNNPINEDVERLLYAKDIFQELYILSGASTPKMLRQLRRT